MAVALPCLSLPPATAEAAPPSRGRPTSAKGAPAATPKLKGILEPVNVKEDISLEDVFFVTPEVGYVTGASGSIFKTTDGGESWTALLGGDPRSKEPPIVKLRFFDDRHGWAVQRDKLIRTTDGDTWEEIGPTVPGLGDYVFVSETTGFATGGPHGNPKFVYKTTNSGRTWKQVFEMRAKVEIEGLTKDADVWATSVHFPTETTGYVVGGHPICGGCGGPPLIAKTEDGGESWSIWLGPGTPKLSAIVKAFFLDETNGLVVLQERKVFSTSDGGQTWRGLVGSPGHDLTFADPEVGWSYRNGPTLTYTVDGGRRWSSREIRLPAHANGISMPRRDRAYIVGEHGMVYRYRIVPIGYEAPLVLEAPLMPGFDTSLDREAEALATEVTALETSLESEAGAEGGSGAEAVDGQDESEDHAAVESDGEDDGEGSTDSEDAASTAPGASTAAGWSPQKYSTRLEKIQTSLAAVSAGIPKFQGKLRNLNLIFFGLEILNVLADQSVNAETALASFRSAHDAQSAHDALADLSQAVRAILATTRTAFHGNANVQ
jgi:photosystem II stability/assembly factor-like uncharacterized protein